MVDNESSTPLPPDTYFEGECDVGPRLLHKPVHLVTSSPFGAHIPLVRAILSYNRALAHHAANDIEEALEAYGMTLDAMGLVSYHNDDVETIKSPHSSSASYAACAARLSMFVHNNVGHVRYMEGEEEDALVHFRTALCWFDHLGERNAETMDDASFMKELYECKATVLSNYARTQWMQGIVNDQTTHAFHTVLQLRQQYLPSDHPDVLSAHLNLGFLLYARNRKTESLTHLRRYLVAADKPNVRARLDPVPALSHIVLAENEDKDDTLSVEVVRAVRALQDKREDFGANHVEVASLLNYIGTILFHRRELEMALRFYREELAVEEGLQDNAPGISISVTHNNIGRIHQELGELQQAITSYRRALQTGSETGLCPSSVAAEPRSTKAFRSIAKKAKVMSQSSMNLFSTIWYNLGLIYDRRGRKGDAIRAFQMSLAIRQTLLGKDHADVACLWYNIGTLQMETRQLDGASRSLFESIRIRRLAELAKPQGGRHVIMTLTKLFALQQKRGQIDAGLTTLSEMAALQEKSKTSHMELCATYRQISEFQHAKGNISAAIRAAHRGFEALLASQALLDPNCAHHMKGVEEIVTTLLMIASLYHEACDPLEAQKTLQKAQGLVEMVVRQHGTVLSPTLRSHREVIRFLLSSCCAAQA